MAQEPVMTEQDLSSMTHEFDKLIFAGLSVSRGDHRPQEKLDRGF